VLRSNGTHSTGNVRTRHSAIDIQNPNVVRIQAGRVLRAGQLPEEGVTYAVTKNYRVFRSSGGRKQEGAQDYRRPNHWRLTVKLTGRARASDWSRGRRLSSRAHGDTTALHGPLQRLLSAGLGGERIEHRYCVLDKSTVYHFIQCG
jgi:hypothetical protein